MGTTLHYRKLNEDNTNPCRALITTNNKYPEGNSSLSYFFSVNISQPKIRVKIPKLLAKMMQRRRRNGCPGDDDNDDDDVSHEQNMGKKKWSRKIGSIISSMFGNRKSHKGYNCCNVLMNHSRDQSHRNLREAFISARLESNDISLNGDRPFAVAPKSPLPISYSMMEKKRGNNDDRRADKCPKESSFSRLSLCLGQTNKTKTRTNNDKRDNISSNMVGISDILIRRQRSCHTITKVPSIVTSVVGTTGIGRQESKSSLPRVPSRILTTRQKLKMARSLTKMASRRSQSKPEQGYAAEREDDTRCEELCKKRILMGGKCRPLNQSGILKYDKDGVLLPELIP